jgi:hypothetical protein
MKVYVTAVLPDGSPSTGKTLELEGSDSTRVPLAETGSPGVYESPHDHSFTSAFRTFDLFIGTEPIRSASLNLDQLTTRVRIVDST